MCLSASAHVLNAGVPQRGKALEDYGASNVGFGDITRVRNVWNARREVDTEAGRAWRLCLSLGPQGAPMCEVHGTAGVWKSLRTC